MNLGPGAVVVKKHDQFYLRCLASLERTEYQTLLYLKVARWAGHLTCMEENRIPKALFYGELAGGHRSRGGRHTSYKDVLKYNLKACDYPLRSGREKLLTIQSGALPPVLHAHIKSRVLF